MYDRMEKNVDQPICNELLKSTMLVFVTRSVSMVDLVSEYVRSANSGWLSFFA